MASIIKIKGKYRAQVRSRGIRRCKTFRTKSEAKVWAIDIEANYHPFVTPQSTAVTIAELIDEYAEQVKPYQQWTSSKDSAIKILKSHIGNIRIQDYDVDTAMQYASARMDERMTPATIHYGLSHLSSIISFGREMLSLDLPSGTCKEAVRRLTRYRGLGLPARRARRPSDTELSAIYFAYEKGKGTIPMKDLINFAVGTTMRRGEIVSLLWIDFDEEKKAIVVRDRKHPTQKKGNDQVVPLIGDTFKIAKRQPRTDDKIFPYDANAISNAFHRLCVKTDVKGLCFHDLRHHGISLLFENGFMIQEVSIMSGHRSWNMLKRYTHIKPESLHRKGV